MRRARWKRKNVSAGRSAQAQTSCRRRGKVGNPARRSETETPGPWGTLQPGDVRDTSSFSFRCRWPVVDESLRSGPMKASVSTNARAARSEAERAEREAGQMRSCTPTTSAPSATGRQSGKSQKSIACPKASPNRSRHRYADPRCARRATAPERVQAAFSFGPCTARFLFRKSEKKTGGASRLDKPPAGAESPWPPDGGPNFHGRFVTSLTRSRGGHTIGPPRAVAPTGARNGFTPARRCAPADNPW